MLQLITICRSRWPCIEVPTDNSQAEALQRFARYLCEPIRNYRILCSILREVCLNVEMIYSKQTQTQRSHVVAQWNKKTSFMNVLILNSPVHAAGLNLHNQRYIGIGLNFVWNMNTILQYMGRLYRTGQKNVVEWYLPTVHGIIYDWTEERVLRKVDCHSLALIGTKYTMEPYLIPSCLSFTCKSVCLPLAHQGSRVGQWGRESDTLIAPSVAANQIEEESYGIWKKQRE